MRGKLEEYERLLELLSVQVDSATQLAIQNVLRKVSIPASRKTQRDANQWKNPTRQKPVTTPRSSDFQRRIVQRQEDSDDTAGGEDGGEDLVSAEVGSAGSVDRVDRDFACDDETISAGFLGKNTEESWMQKIAQRLETIELIPTPVNAPTAEAGRLFEESRSGLMTGRKQISSVLTGHQQPQLSDFQYQADEIDLSAPDRVNELELPPRHVADLFVNAYFTTVHSSFPMLLKRHFFQAYEQCFTPYAQPMSRRWRAILNLVFAIGAKYLALTRAEGCDEHDHLTFFSRARSLSLDNGALWQKGDLEQVQVIALATLYLTTTEHINRYVRPRLSPGLEQTGR